MANFEIPEEVEFNSELRMIETTDRAHADLFNGMFGQLLLNEVFLKLLAEELKKSVSDGKNLVADAITDNGVETATDATFETIATNIVAVAMEKYQAGMTDADNRANVDSTNYKTGYNAGVSDTKKGTATTEDVLEGETFTNSSGVGLSGTMPIAPTYPSENTANDFHVHDDSTSQSEVGNNVFLQVPKGYYNNTWVGYRDDNLIASNIKKGVQIGSSKKYITGTYTSDATATAEDILTGEMAYVDGVKVTGSMTNNGAKTANLDCGESYTIPKGYHDGNGKVTANSLASQTDGTAIASDILSGETAYVDGVKVTGTMTNNGAVSKALNCSGSYTIPKGYHDGTGKVTANSLASQTDGTATASDILNGKTAYVDGEKITGTAQGAPSNGTKWSLTNNGGSTYYSSIELYGYGAGAWIASIYSGANSSSYTGIYKYISGTAWSRKLTYQGKCLYANGLWICAVNNVGIYYSTDAGDTWTLGTSISSTFVDLLYSRGIWVAVSSGGMYYSTDGKAWSKPGGGSLRSSINTSVKLYCFNNIWILCGCSGLTDTLGMYYSTDGKVWYQSSSLTTGTYKYVAVNEVFVLASVGNGLYYSTDGKGWTQSNITSGTFNKVYNSDGVWVACSSAGMYYSTDGKVWYQSNITSGEFTDVCNANGMWVATATGAGLYYSTDGKSWTQSNLTSVTVYDIIYMNKRWIIGTNTGLYYSTDGKSWTQSDITTGTFNKVYNANGEWMAGGSTKIYCSKSA